jgi:hypothetical protein
VFRVLTNGDATGPVTPNGFEYDAPTLRAAIDAANDAGTFPGVDRIYFGVPAGQETVLVSANDTNRPFAFGPTAFVIAGEVAIESLPGSPVITIDGQGQRRLFGVLPGGTLTFRNMTLTGGNARGGNGGNVDDVLGYGGGGGGAAGLGGAIFNAGTLNVHRTTFRGNTAQGGRGGNSGSNGVAAGGGGGAVGGNGGDVVSNNMGGGGAGVGGPGGDSNSGSGGAGETGSSASAESPGILGGGGGGGNSGPGATRNGGSGAALSSGGFGGGGGGSKSSGQGGDGGFGAGGGGAAGDAGNGGFGGGGGGVVRTPPYMLGTGGFGGGNGGSEGNDTIAGGGGGGGGMGGAIFNNGGTVLLTESTLSGNLAQGGDPGTRSNAPPPGPGMGLGGGLFTNGGAVTIANCTFTSNTARGGTTYYFGPFYNAPDGIGRGGGIFNLNGTMTIRHCTIALNVVLSIYDNVFVPTIAGGRGIYNLGSGNANTATAALGNVLIGQADTVTEDFTGEGESGGVNTTSGVGNLIRTQSGFAGTIVSTGDPRLGPLLNHGGLTNTMALLFGSPAIDAADSTLCNQGPVSGLDQRGRARPVDGNGDSVSRCDLGAYEAPAVPSLTTQASPSVVVGGSISDTATLSGNSPTGTLIFTAYSNGTCTGTPVFTSSPIVVNGNGAYGSGSFVANAAGTYNFIVSYDGDDNNGGVATSCLAPNESVVVTKAPATLSSVASPSIAVGGAISDTATLTGGFNPQGTITFTAFTNNTCTGTPALTSGPIAVNGNGSYSSGPFMTTQAGVYNFVVAYSGDTNNLGFTGGCLAPNESVVVSKAPATLSTVASSSIAVGGAISDTATLTGGFNPQGTITFTAFTNNTCTGTPAFTSGPIAVNGNGSYSSGPFMTTEVGTYNFVAVYSGDTNNLSFTGACLDVDESVIVTQAPTTLTTVASPSIAVGGAISDTATLTGGFNPQGTITFTAFTNNTCTGTPAFTSGPVAVNGNGSYSSGPFITTEVGTYNFVAVYSGDTNNNAFTTECLAANAHVVVTKAAPSLASQASAPVTVGGAISDTATLTGGFTPTGTLTFTAFANETCAGAPAFTSAPVVVNGAGSYSSGAFTPASAGTYNFVVAYTGDVNNESIITPCLAPNESVVVARAIPALAATASPSLAGVNEVVRDQATLSGGYSPAGSITFELFAPGDTGCTSPIFTSVRPVDGAGTYTSDSYVPLGVGTYQWTARYSGDANNTAAGPTACADPAQAVAVSIPIPVTDRSGLVFLVILLASLGYVVARR